jgi:ubiquinol-cytochrome c reductase cytochrome b subunit
MIGSLWVAGQQSPWSPNFQALPLTEKVIGATSGAVFEGAQLSHDKACLSCHLIQGHGGRRGPDLTYVADKLSRDNIIIRIVNGGNNNAGVRQFAQTGGNRRLGSFLAIAGSITGGTKLNLSTFQLSTGENCRN